MLFSELSNLRSLAADLDLLSRVTVTYMTMPGWKASISSIRTYSQLPHNCRAYVEEIERRCGIPVEWIGVGPEREAMIKKTAMLEEVEKPDGPPTIG